MPSTATVSPASCTTSCVDDLQPTCQESIGNSWAAHNKTFNEIWFGVPENGATNPNVAYVFNYRDGTFAIRDLEREINHAHFGDEPASVDIPWSSMSEVWDNERGAWTMGGDRPFEKVLYGVTDSVYDIDPSFGTVSSATEQSMPTIITAPMCQSAVTRRTQR